MIIQDGVLLQVASYESKGDLVIPDGVKSIGRCVFEFCSDLTSVTVPDSITSIGYFSFYGCTGLKNVTIGNGVTNIGGNAFGECVGLRNITIGNSLTSIGPSTFSCCYNLKSKVGNYKAFEITSSGKLKCLCEIYSEGHKSFVKGNLKICENGIHYCTNLFEIFNYYYGELDKNIAIYECEVSDESVGETDSSKRCAKWIIPRKRLYREDVIRILNGGE